MHLPIAEHLALFGQPAQGLKGAAFLPAFAVALGIIIFPYIIFSNKKVNGTSRFLQQSFLVELQTVSPELCQRVLHALSQRTQRG